MCTYVNKYISMIVRSLCVCVREASFTLYLLVVYGRVGLLPLIVVWVLDVYPCVRTFVCISLYGVREASFALTGCGGVWKSWTVSACSGKSPMFPLWCHTNVPEFLWTRSPPPNGYKWVLRWSRKGMVVKVKESGENCDFILTFW